MLRVPLRYRALFAIAIGALLASCSGAGNLPQSRSSGSLPQSRSLGTPPQSLASCFRSAPLSERLNAASACRMKIAHVATLHRSRTPLNLAGSSGITTFDVPNAATASICSPDELFNVCGTSSLAVNNAGTITGFYLNTNHEFVGFTRSAGGQIASFEAPGITAPGGGTEPTTISNTGAIGGMFLEANLVVNDGWIREADGTFVNADAPFASSDPTSANSQGSFVNGINVGGDAAGVWFDVLGKPHSFIRSPDGAFVKIVPPNARGGRSGVCPIGCLNAGGTVLGGFAIADGTELAYIRSATGSITEFGATGAPFTEPSGINAGGETSGFYFDSNFLQWGFTRDIRGTISAFQAPDADLSPFNGTNVDAISDNGAVTGTYFDSSGTAHGFYRSPAGQFAEFDPTNSVFTVPTAINASGEVVGVWLDAQGQVHGFLWLPH